MARRQAHNTIANHCYYGALFTDIQAHVDFYAERYLSVPKGTYTCSTSWYNHYPTGSESQPHSHTAAVSAIFTLRDHPNPVWFYRPESQRSQLLSAATGRTWPQALRWRIDSLAGRLILFPSYVAHSVEPVAQERYSISADYDQEGTGAGRSSYLRSY
jgi:predicted 2-oxoglutarate/Fe(II)-dependent dioxygenase YbiX